MIRKLIAEHPVFKEKQRYDYNCGPACMTYAMSMCGWEADQEDLVGVMVKWLMKKLGTLPTWFGKICNEYGICYEDLVCQDEYTFISFLAEHLKGGNPAIILVEGGHWVCAVGMNKDKVIINDPASGKTLESWTIPKLLKTAYSYVDCMEFEGYYAFLMDAEEE